MSRVKKVDEVAILSERMVDLLEALRLEGSGTYPPTLGELAEASGLSVEDGRVLKVVAKKPFTEKATAKVTPKDKVTLESRVYFKEDVPKKVVLTKAEAARLKAEAAERKLAELAGRLIRVLESQRDLGGDAYPPTFHRLAKLADLNDKTTARKVAGHEAIASEVTFANSAKLYDSPVILNRDLDARAAAWNQAVLDFALKESRKIDQSPKLGFTPKELATKLQPTLRASFEKELKARLARLELPANYAWLANKEPLIFLVSDIQPGPPARAEGHAHAQVHAEAPRAVSPPPATREFASSFREAFDQLDRRNGLSNHVKLVDLRRELADFGRERFDVGLRQLRVEREFSLDSHEGLVKPLTTEEREAGIVEAGSVLVYVSRR